MSVGSREQAIDERLAKEGWERRSILSEPRLSEAVREYRELGFEVRLEPVRPGDPEIECDVCFPADSTAQVVYTRRAVS